MVTKTRKIRWKYLDDERLLDCRFKDLRLRIEKCEIYEGIKQLYHELEEKNIRFRPHCWFGEEWFSPDGIPGISIPFYLAHPRLKKLEARQMYDVEGGYAGRFSVRSVINIRTTIHPGHKAGAMYFIWTGGMPRPIPRKTLQKPLRSGCGPAQNGDLSTGDGRH